jgi:hypothetical protein
MEGGLEKQYDIYGTMTDCCGNLKLSSLLYFAQDTAVTEIRHLSFTQAGI